MGVVAVLGVVTSLMSLLQGQQGQQQQKEELGKMKILPKDPTVFAPTAGPANSQQPRQPSFSQPKEIMDFNTPKEKSGGMGGMMDIIGLIGSLFGKSNSGGFANSGGLNSAFQGYETSKLGGMDWRNSLGSYNLGNLGR